MFTKRPKSRRSLTQEALHNFGFPLTASAQPRDELVVALTFSMSDARGTQGLEVSEKLDYFSLLRERARRYETAPT